MRIIKEYSGVIALVLIAWVLLTGQYLPEISGDPVVQRNWDAINSHRGGRLFFVTTHELDSTNTDVVLPYNYGDTSNYFVQVNELYDTARYSEDPFIFLPEKLSGDSIRIHAYLAETGASTPSCSSVVQITTYLNK